MNPSHVRRNAWILNKALYSTKSKRSTQIVLIQEYEELTHNNPETHAVKLQAKHTTLQNLQ